MDIYEQIYECKCGAKTKARIEYSNFGPMNNDKWHIDCHACGNHLGTEKCNHLTTSPA
ncbi:hypothetical protein [Neorhizobium galegae]|uniref:hypothetical protein n=1 Tax=Neorhizobium galegae TaxID=399 RepID=UPI002102DF47|nr:hypothetical protein [Neorhizobium galegae]MCQ1850384.1 hypothetical protein [Neorhizobium galegae]